MFDYSLVDNIHPLLGVIITDDFSYKAHCSRNR